MSNTTTRYKGFEPARGGPLQDHAFLCGDRLDNPKVESIMFLIKVLDDGTLLAETAPKSRRAMRGLDEGMWLDEATAAAQSTDYLSQTEDGGSAMFLLERDPMQAPFRVRTRRAQ